MNPYLTLREELIGRLDQMVCPWDKHLIERLLMNHPACLTCHDSGAVTAAADPCPHCKAGDDVRALATPTTTEVHS